MAESVQSLRERLAYLMTKISEARDRRNIELADSLTEIATPMLIQLSKSETAEKEEQQPAQQQEQKQHDKENKD